MGGGMCVRRVAVSGGLSMGNLYVTHTDEQGLFHVNMI